jgi:uncharacterized membrane protein YbhN (UPF0104 family)
MLKTSLDDAPNADLAYNGPMSKQSVRQAASITIVLVTIVVFAAYFHKHPHTFAILKAVPPLTIFTLFVLYAAFIGSLVWIQDATLRLCDLRLPRKESTLLMMYSAIVNFFGPLQSGPGFRAAYLKTKHDVNLKKYTLATLLYYGFYALASGLLLLAFIIGWWVLIGAAAIIAAAPLVFRLQRFKSLDISAVRSLALATVVQSAIQSVIYFVELHSLLSHTAYTQALIYTGAANFALFVSITPGAIGFRESFLLLAQRLHHIPGAIIATASLIDRSVYASRGINRFQPTFNKKPYTYR